MKSYTINHAEAEIKITRTFNEKANVINSEEYRTIMRLKKDFPNYTLVLREVSISEGKQKYGRLTYAKMDEYIRIDAQRRGLTEETAEQEIAELKMIQKIAKANGSGYAFTKHWFLDKYPNYKKETTSEETANEEKGVA